MARKILLADDSVTAQNMGRRILTDAGYDVVTVNNGSAALKKISEQKPDLIVLDVYMPGYGGLEVCQRIKEGESTSRIPVLLTVGKLEPFKPDEARRVRADAYVVKPFEASELLAALTKLEDKIVPQGEPRKSARVKSKVWVEGAPSDNGDQFGDAETGWKNRLKVPPVERTQPATEESKAAAANEHSAPSPREAKITALPAPSLLPPDITPEEIAALAAAAQAINTGPAPETAAYAAKPPAGNSLPFSSAAQTPVPPPVSETVGNGPALPPHGAHPDDRRDSEVAAALASLAPLDSRAGQDGPAATNSAGESAAGERPIDTSQTTLTSGAAQRVGEAPEASKGPRWVAVEVALTADESALVLQKAMESPGSAATDPGPMSAPQRHEALAMGETSRAPVSPAPAAEAVAGPVSPAAAATSDRAADLANATAPVPAVESPPAKDSQPPPPPATIAESAPESAPVVALAAAAPASAPAIETTPAVPVETRVPVHSEAAVAAVTAPAGTEPENHRNAETAAAWEHWQKVRDSVVGSQLAVRLTESAVADIKEIHKDAPAADANRDRQQDQDDSRQASSDVPAPTNPTAIASIVDSVLAELRPKLVAEITRKLEGRKNE